MNIFFIVAQKVCWSWLENQLIVAIDNVARSVTLPCELGRPHAYYWLNQEYMRTRVCNSRFFFCYESCHSRMSSSSSLPTSICSKKGKKLLSSSVELNVEHCTLTDTWTQRASAAWSAGQKDRAFGVSEHARVQRRVHNDLKREWLCVIDDTLEILPWQTPKYGVAYSCSHILLTELILVPHIQLSPLQLTATMICNGSRGHYVMLL